MGRGRSFKNFYSTGPRSGPGREVWKPFSHIFLLCTFPEGPSPSKATFNLKLHHPNMKWLWKNLRKEKGGGGGRETLGVLILGWWWDKIVRTPNSTLFSSVFFSFSFINCSINCIVIQNIARHTGDLFINHAVLK